MIALVFGMPLGTHQVTHLHVLGNGDGGATARTHVQCPPAPRTIVPPTAAHAPTESVRLRSTCVKIATYSATDSASDSEFAENSTLGQVGHADSKN